MLTIQIATTTLLNDFINYPWALHRQDPLWIPPIKENIRNDFNGTSCFAQYATLIPLLCYEDDKIVGRIAAIINPNLVDQTNHIIGQLGYFECEPRLEIAQLLIQRACEQLAKFPVQQVWGPIDGGVHKNHRFMTSGFNTEPFFVEPRNPAYYPEFFQLLGFTPIYSWYSGELKQQAATKKRLQRFAKYHHTTTSQHSYHIDQTIPHSTETVQRLNKLVNLVWSKNVGFVPLSSAEFYETYAGMLALMKPGQLNFLRDDKGQDCAFFLSFPNYAEAIRNLDGDYKKFHTLTNIQPPKQLIVHSMGVIPDFPVAGRTRELASISIDMMLQSGYENNIFALTIESQKWQKKFTTVNRTYALYQHKLAALL